MNVNLDTFSAGPLGGGSGGGDTNESIITTSVSGSAGIDALDALLPSTDDYGIIGLGGINQVLVRKIDNGWYRPLPFNIGAYTIGANSYADATNTPAAQGWNVDVPAGGTVDYNTTVAGKIYMEGGTTSATAINDDVITRTASVDGFGMIYRSVKVSWPDAGTINRAEFIVGPKLGGTAYLVENKVDNSVNVTDFVLNETTTHDTGVPFAAPIDFEYYGLTDGSVITYKNWESAPALSGTVTYANAADFGIFNRVTARSDGGTGITEVEFDSMQAIELIA